jgi:adenosylhomocysteine nucleosidase
MAGVVVALVDEASALTPLRLHPGDLVPVSDTLWLAVCGIGADRARRAAERLLHHGVKALATWGTAGGLDPTLPRGALVLPKRVIAPDGRSYAVDAEWRWRLEQALTPHAPVFTGPLLTSACPLDTVDAKAVAFAGSGAIAVDMESGAVAECAAAAQRPFVALRAIIDTADEALPQASLAALDAEGKLHLNRLLRALLRRPREIGALLALRQHFAIAHQALKVAAAQAPGLLAQPGES